MRGGLAVNGRWHVSPSRNLGCGCLRRFGTHCLHKAWATAYPAHPACVHHPPETSTHHLPTNRLTCQVPALPWGVRCEVNERGGVGGGVMQPDRTAALLLVV